MKHKYFTLFFSGALISMMLFSIDPTLLSANVSTQYFNSSLNADKRYGITIKAPEIAENGAVVSVRVNMFGFENNQLYVKKLQLFVCHLGFRPLATIKFNGPSSQYTTRIRMNKTDSIFAKATLNTGEYVYARFLTKVTVGGCGGGGSASFTHQPIVGASTPANSGNEHARSWIKSSLTDNSSRLMTRDNRLLLQKSMRVDVKIAGHRARVMMDMEFYNPYSFQNEGRFQLRLPETAIPYYLAFGDVVVMDRHSAYQHLPSAKTSGFSSQQLQFDRHQHPAKLKEAVLVPRKKARNAYQTIVGQRRDPALVEWQGNGVYSVNVFPLLPYSSHRVVIAYDMDLAKSNPYLQYVFKSPANKMPIDVYVQIDNNTAQNIKSLNTIPELASRGLQRLYHFKPKQNEEIKFLFANLNKYFLHGVDKHTGDYFAIKLKIPLAKELTHASNSTAIFALDTSATPNGNHFADQLQMAVNLLHTNDDDIKQFAVLFFDVGTHWWQTKFVANTAANRNAFQAYAKRINLAGATDLHRAIKQLSKPSWYKTSMAKNWDIFLFSDGFARWGDTRPAALVNSLKQYHYIKHLYAYVAPGQLADLDLLDLLTHEANGAIYDFQNYYNGNYAAMQQSLIAHRLRHWRIVGAYSAGAKDIFTANASFTSYANQTLVFVGRGHPKNNINVLLQSGDEVRNIAVALPKKIIETDLTPRIYAEAAVRKLEDSPDQHARLSLAYASHFRVPRQTVSLLMLETEKDYHDFKIANQADYKNFIKHNPVAQIIASLTAPKTAQQAPYEIADIPKNQLQEILQISQSISVCKIPDSYLLGFDKNNLNKYAPIQHRPLQLSSATMMENTDLSYYYSLDHYAQKQIFTHAQKLQQQGKIQASLRTLSSILEKHDLSSETRLKISKQLLALGLANESYFLIRMANEAYSETSFELLVKSVELQKQTQHAKALRSLAKIVSVFTDGKQALQAN